MEKLITFSYHLHTKEPQFDKQVKGCVREKAFYIFKRLSLGYRYYI